MAPEHLPQASVPAEGAADGLVVTSGNFFPAGSAWRAPPLAETPFPCLTARVAMPYQIATLLYCFNEQDEVLLLERAQEPNRGLWSPPGGKLHTADGESPYACACREAHEEMGLALQPFDLHLAGLVSEYGYAGQSHWLMFLFEVKSRLKTVPPPHREGRFQFFPQAALAGLSLPETDRAQIWPLFWHQRGGFFAAHCHVSPDGQYAWTLEALSASLRPSAPD